jgi:hypothetical protein
MKCINKTTPEQRAGSYLIFKKLCPEAGGFSKVVSMFIGSNLFLDANRQWFILEMQISPLS